MPILIIADKGFHKLYRAFATAEHQLYECTPPEARDFVVKCRADLILLDCGSNVDGCLEILKDIKARYPSIPVIFLSEFSAEDAVLRAFRSGARDFIKKPVNLSELRETVDGILSVRKTALERRRPFKPAGPVKKDPFRTLTTSHPVNLINVMRHMEDNLATPASLHELAEIAGISKYHFCRFFKKHIGVSPLKYMLTRRVEKAKELLRREDAPVSAIASSVGFSDMSSFTVQFKKLTGKPPVKYKLTWKKAKIKRKKKLKEKLMGGRKKKAGKKITKKQQTYKK